MESFQEQLKKRRFFDDELLQEAFVGLSRSVMGENAWVPENERKRMQSAIGAVLAYFKVDLPSSPPPEIEDLSAQIDWMLRPSGLQKRTVRLSPGWYKDCAGPILGEKNGKVVTFLPRGLSGYYYVDFDSGKTVKVTKKTAADIKPRAYCFYQALPSRPLSVADLLKFAAQSVLQPEFFLSLLVMSATTAIGMITPAAYNLMFSSAVPINSAYLLLYTMTLLVGAAISGFLMKISQNLLSARRSAILQMNLQAAFMSRLLSLPAPFFRAYSAGELAQRVNVIPLLCNALSNTLIPLAGTLFFSLFYAAQILFYTPSLFGLSMFFVVVQIVATIGSIIAQTKQNTRIFNDGSHLNGFVYEMLSSIQKIRLSGSERRAFAKWALLYSKVAKNAYDPPGFLKIVRGVFTMISLLAVIVTYAVVTGNPTIHTAEYMAFTVSFGMINATLAALRESVPVLANIKPVFTMLAPLMEAQPENSSVGGMEKEIVTSLTGRIEINNISFRYAPDAPLILDNFSLKVEPGQYVAIVGKTGCGKSTLLRLLLGFEQPLLGSVYYDGKDMANLDVKTLRQNIGTVTQNGNLLFGSILENIIVSAPHLTIEDAWEAAEIAGIASDIRAMPMGMFTMISGNGDTFSGGQKQRLLIARAVAGRPRILFLDEATSALDNITQKRVSEALNRFKSTRIVIAHRLTTIRLCDRILVMDKGTIVEDGAYDDLLAKGGVFADLVERQRLDVEIGAAKMKTL